MKKDSNKWQLAAINIEKVFDEYNFEYKVQKKGNIFIGENGIGKSTILGIIYNTLSANFTKLNEYYFDAIEVSFTCGINEKSFRIERESLSTFDQRNLESFGSHYDRAIKIFEKNKLKLIETFSFNDFDNQKEFNFIVENLNRETLGRPIPPIRFRRMITELTESYLQSSDNIAFHKFLNENYSIKILYFPTYRRIEGNIREINGGFSSDRDPNIRDLNNRDFNNRAELYGDLVNFGMADVKESINNLLQTIKSSSIESFNKMTGELLKQYLKNENENLDKIADLERSEIELSLRRIGTEIDTEIINNILSMYDNDTLKSNQNLVQFLYKLVTKGRELKEIDRKITKFSETCNSYLKNKYFKYNSSLIKVDLISASGKHLDISNLSSGEKQIVSTFSKLILSTESDFVILFDEPELSLSIEWQNKYLPDLLKLDNCKLMFAVTHSPSIIEDLFHEAMDINDYIIPVAGDNNEC